MSENDYIAEYIKENRPEIVHSIDFYCWKIKRVFEEVANGIKGAIKKGYKAGDQEGEDGQGDEEAQSASDAQ